MLAKKSQETFILQFEKADAEIKKNNIKVILPDFINSVLSLQLPHSEISGIPLHSALCNFVQSKIQYNGSRQ